MGILYDKFCTNARKKYKIILNILLETFDHIKKNFKTFRNARKTKHYRKEMHKSSEFHNE